MWRRAKVLLSWLVPVLLLLAFAGTWICHFNQWDSLTFITVVPFWMWALPGILLSLASALLIRSWLSYIAFAVWFLTAIFTSAETRGLFRSAVERQVSLDSLEAGHRFTLVSINCSGGGLEAAREALVISADVVLLQDAPSQVELEILTEALFGGEGSFVAGVSNAILGRGEFLTFAGEPESPSIHARFKHRNGALLDLTNVKLEQAIPEVEIWKESVREQMKLTRIRNRKSVRRFIGEYESNSLQPVRIVAGEFATPPGDDIFRPLKKAGLKDAFRHSGRGTGNTWPAKFPVLRVDQVWISPEVNLLKTYTMPSEYSDHLLVVCEFFIKP